MAEPDPDVFLDVDPDPDVFLDVDPDPDVFSRCGSGSRSFFSTWIRIQLLFECGSRPGSNLKNGPRVGAKWN